MISGETLLNNGDRIALGINHFFKLNCPITPTNSSLSQSLQSSPAHSPSTHRKPESDFKSAQEEVLLPANKQQQQTSESEDGENKATSSPSSLSPTNSIDENGVALEYAIKKLEDEYSTSWQTVKRVRSSGITSTSRLSNSSSSSSLSRYNSEMIISENELNFRKGLDKLREQLLRSNSLAREANSICKEINKPFRFGVTLQIPAHNLTPNHKVSSSSSL